MGTRTQEKHETQKNSRNNWNKRTHTHTHKSNKSNDGRKPSDGGSREPSTFPSTHLSCHFSFKFQLRCDRFFFAMSKKKKNGNAGQQPLRGGRWGGGLNWDGDTTTRNDERAKKNHFKTDAIRAWSDDVRSRNVTADIFRIDSVSVGRKRSGFPPPQPRPPSITTPLLFPFVICCLVVFIFLFVCIWFRLFFFAVRQRGTDSSRSGSLSFICCWGSFFLVLVIGATVGYQLVCSS